MDDHSIDYNWIWAMGSKCGVSMSMDEPLDFLKETVSESPMDGDGAPFTKIALGITYKYVPDGESGYYVNWFLIN